MASFMDFPIESTDLNNNYSSEPNNNYYVEVDLDEIFIDYSINSSNDDLDNMIRDIDISDEHFDYAEANDETVVNFKRQESNDYDVVWDAIIPSPSTNGEAIKMPKKGSKNYDKLWLSKTYSHQKKQTREIDEDGCHDNMYDTVGDSIV